MGECPPTRGDIEAPTGGTALLVEVENFVHIIISKWYAPTERGDRWRRQRARAQRAHYKLRATDFGNGALLPQRGLGSDCRALLFVQSVIFIFLFF